ncbi:MAG: hypothetical protein GXP42_18605 [Chloroflexi bacterium]|nr:hypothetical protein [Chloroflexota bacterium]
MSILDFGPVGATRRNHAIEHATIHILTNRLPSVSMAGRSNSRGFVIYGDISAEAIRDAVLEAIERIRNGETHLAIHPNCGTNMVTTAVLTAAATMLATAGRRRHLLDRIPAGVLGALAGVFLGQFLGASLQQRLTTCAQLDQVDLLGVERKQIGNRVMHRVRLEHHTVSS